MIQQTRQITRGRGGYTRPGDRQKNWDILQFTRTLHMNCLPGLSVYRSLIESSGICFPSTKWETEADNTKTTNACSMKSTIRYFIRYQYGVITLSPTPPSPHPLSFPLPKHTMENYLQALIRGHLARRQYARDRARIIRIQAAVRSFICRAAITTQVLGASRLQRCIRSWLRNRELYKSITGLFDAASRGDVRDITRYITDSPQLLYVRDRYGVSCVEGGVLLGECCADDGGAPVYSTLLHAACQVREYPPYEECG